MDSRIYGNPDRTLVPVTRRHPKGRDDENAGLQSIPAAVPGAGTPQASNPLSIDRRYDASVVGSVGPHAQTERWRYQVPLRRRTKIETVFAEVLRSAVGGTNQPYYGRVELQRSGAQDWTPVCIASSSQGTTIVSGGQRQVNSGPFDMYEGDTIRAVTADTTAGGTVGYTLTLIGTEFDAVPSSGS